jgi:hypothetical protein
MSDSIKLGEKYYETESVTDLTIAIMRDLKTIDDQIKTYGTQLSIAKLAKSKLIDELQKEVPKMKEVPAPESGNK